MKLILGKEKVFNIKAGNAESHMKTPIWSDNIVLTSTLTEETRL